MNPDFTTTRWSLVLAAQAGESTQSRRALGELCEAYWFPLYAFVRRQGYSAEDARDLTQGYFARLLEKEDLKDVDPHLGRFRAFLLASLKHFLSNARDRARAKKRSPEKPLLELDSRTAEERFSIEPADDLTPQDLFERKWAMTVLERTLERLGREWSDGDRARRFEKLRGYLTDEDPGGSYRETAGELGISEDAVKVAVHRLRRRYGELLREEIAQTVTDPREIDDEIRYLLGVLGG
jgi:RNA polymerase sigma-70 factor (ECF subfamily)